MSSFKLPPCEVNPKTEKPYLRHRWIIRHTTDGTLLHVDPKSAKLVYHVVCDRCGIIDPKLLEF